MGLFKKTKKEDNVYQETNENLQKIKDETESEIGKLESEIQEKNERLSTILDKIELSKKEYDEIVGKIIQSKKELRALGTSQVNTNETRVNNQITDDISKDISDSKIELKNIQNDIAKKIEINKELEEKIKKNQPFVSDSENQKKKIDEELNQRKNELEVLKKRLGEIKKTDTKNNEGDDSKNVVEAASQIIATTNKRLQDTTKELEVIRQLLDKERKAHNETKKKLLD
jgi:DNA repair exonuclease SbcCD ATPase subunit